LGVVSGGKPYGMRYDMKDRRGFPRRGIETGVVAALSPERSLPRATTVDIGRGGLLMAFVEPVGFVPGHRLLVTLPAVGFRFHAFGRVVRCERGADARVYVAIAFVDVSDGDFDELSQHLDELTNSAA
jgi:hypothetical protein